jgi:hypothetical protein
MDKQRTRALLERRGRVECRLEAPFTARPESGSSSGILCSPDDLNQRHVNPEYSLYQTHTHRTVEGNRTRKSTV